jgi:hypothetical protein
MIFAFLHHHILRKIYSFFVNLYLLPEYYFKSRTIMYRDRKTDWAKISNDIELILFFRKFNNLKRDSCTYDMNIYQFLNPFVDMKDSSRYVYKKLKKLNYVTQRLAIYDFLTNTFYYDCLYYRNGDWILFNNGNTIHGSSITDVINKYKTIYNTYSFITFKCYW